ncbi:MAG: sigma-70 family RNA polymerase sigma factor [Vicinamibacterales bacterium]
MPSEQMRRTGPPMATTEPVAPLRAEASPAEVPDAVLVRRCLQGDEAAWALIVNRYKRLIYSIPLKYGATHDGAGDIFQAVCVELVTELPKLRKPEALKGWLVSVAQHKSLKAKQRAKREVGWVGAESVGDAVVDDDPNAARIIEEAQRDQSVHDAVADLPGRCQELVRMLFFTEEPVPYTEVAARLGLAVGSIGFIRGRCLKKLESALKARGI